VTLVFNVLFVLNQAYVCVQEDRLLMRAVQTVKKASAGGGVSTIKWPDVAKLVPMRTGKQCRERYFNHLVPTVVSTEWTPLEDSIVCRMYQKFGSKWAFISKVLPGRSDNNVKNRFHYLRRQLEKQSASTLGMTGSADASRVDSSLKEKIMKASQGTKPNDEIACMVIDLMVHMISTGCYVLSPADLSPGHFGPFEAPQTEPVTCKRCSLFIPASQTGLVVCRTTGWCVSCSQTMVYVSGELLRVAHTLRCSTKQANV
jgi:Myb-like DNA-binding domain